MRHINTTCAYLPDGTVIHPNFVGDTYFRRIEAQRARIEHSPGIIIAEGPCTLKSAGRFSDCKQFSISGLQESMKNLKFTVIPEEQRVCSCEQREAVISIGMTLDGVPVSCGECHKRIGYVDRSGNVHFTIVVPDGITVRIRVL